MEVEVLAPAQWQPLLVRETGVDSSALANLLAAVHRRHAGLSVQAAASWLRGGSGSLRAAILKRLSDALFRLPRDTPHAIKPSLDGRFLDLLPPSQLVVQVLGPLALRACRQMSRTILFGQSDVTGPSSAAAQYAEYEMAFGREIDAIVTAEPAKAERFFWDKLALQVWIGAHAAAEQLTPLESGAPAPEDDHVPANIDGGVLHFLKVLEPRFPRRTHSSLTRVRQQQDNIRPSPLKQAGVRGIRVSRALADVQDRLFSEFTHPRIIQLDRLINSGFLVRLRPPPLGEQRRLLLVGLASEASTASGHAFAKAMWLDAAERLAALLVQAGVRMTDLVHITRMDEDMAMRVAVSLDTPSPYRSEVDALSFGAHERLAMLRAHGWLPGFLDTNPKILPTPNREGIANHRQGLAGHLERTTLAAFHHFPPSIEAVASDRTRAFEQYGRIHAQVFLPMADMPTAENRTAWMDELARAIGLNVGKNANITVVGMPRRADEAFHVLQARRAPTVIEGVVKERGRALNAVATDLSGALLHGALETLHG